MKLYHGDPLRAADFEPTPEQLRWLLLVGAVFFNVHHCVFLIRLGWNAVDIQKCLMEIKG